MMWKTTLEKQGLDPHLFYCLYEITVGLCIKLRDFCLNDHSVNNLLRM